MKNKWHFTLNIIIVVIFLVSCNSGGDNAKEEGKGTASQADIDLFFRSCTCGTGSIVVSSSIANDRRAEFTRAKSPELNSIATVIDGNTDQDILQIDKIAHLKNVLNNYFINHPKVDGVRIYFGTRWTKKEEDTNDAIGEKEDGINKGRMVFIFSPVTKVSANEYEDLDSNTYFVYRKNVKRHGFFAIKKTDQAKRWVMHYQIGNGKGKNSKRAILTSKVPPADKLKDTKHVLFSKDKLIELNCQIEDCIHTYPNIVGMQLRMVSYLDTEKYAKRTTIDFVFTDSLGNEVSIACDTLKTLVLAAAKEAPFNTLKNELYYFYMANKNEPFEKSIEKFKNKFSKISFPKEVWQAKILMWTRSFDTGDPTPPERNGIMEGLDAEAN